MPNEKPTSRRDFLRGHSLGRSLLNVARGLADKAVESFDKNQPQLTSGSKPPAENRTAVRHRSSADNARIHTSRQAMACEFAVEYHAADGADAADAALAALDLVERLEDQLSVYRDHTEVAEINRMAADRAVEVEPRLFALLELCDWIHASTHGAFDITSGPLSRIWGFHKREGRLPSQDEIDAALVSVGFNQLQLNHENQ